MRKLNLSLLVILFLIIVNLQFVNGQNKKGSMIKSVVHQAILKHHQKIPLELITSDYQQNVNKSDYLIFKDGRKLQFEYVINENIIINIFDSNFNRLLKQDITKNRNIDFSICEKLFIIIENGSSKKTFKTY